LLAVNETILGNGLLFSPKLPPRERVSATLLAVILA
jgi:hypothetical protein